MLGKSSFLSNPGYCIGNSAIMIYSCKVGSTPATSLSLHLLWVMSPASTQLSMNDVIRHQSAKLITCLALRTSEAWISFNFPRCTRHVINCQNIPDRLAHVDLENVWDRCSWKHFLIKFYKCFNKEKVLHNKLWVFLCINKSTSRINIRAWR